MASLLTSAEPRIGARNQEAPKAAASMTSKGPSILLPLMFISTGVLSLCLGTLWLVLRPSILASYHYNQYVIATTHLFVLGWICSIVMGAMYQLVPVALETKLYSEKLAYCQYVFHFVGFAGMVWMFRIWNMTNLAHFGSAFAIGVALFVYNIARTLRRVSRWNATATAAASALFWISLTVVAGLSLAAAKCDYDTAFEKSPPAFVALMLHGLQSVGHAVLHFDPISAMHAHAHLGVIGCFTMLIVGVSYKLIPMFTLSELQSSRRAAWSIILLNVGLVGAFTAILLRSALKPVAALVTVAALALYGWEILAILRARKRRALDWGVKYFLSGVTMMVPISVLAFVLSWPKLPLTTFTGQLENLYGFLGVVGFVSLAIIGMLYKIVPFLVWFGTYSRHVGRARVPALAELYSPTLQKHGYWAYLAGLIASGAAVVISNETGVRVGCTLLALGILALVINLARMLTHFFRPRLAPL